MTRRRAPAPLLSVVLVALLTPPAAHAQGADVAAAEGLFAEAKQLMTQGKLADACPKLLASLQLDPKPGTAVNLADCLEKNGQIASAWARYKEAATLAGKAGQAEREKYAKDHAAALEPKLSRLSITALSPPAGLAVSRDGAVVNPAILGTAVPVDPGKHEIEARAPGKKTWSKTVEVAAGVSRLAVEIPPLEDGANAAPPGAPAPSEGGVRVHIASPTPLLAMQAVDLGGRPFVCAPPCDREVQLRVPMYFSGEGIPPSTKFAFAGPGAASFEVHPGSSGKRAGAIALLTAGSLAAVGGAVLIGVGTRAGTRTCDLFTGANCATNCDPTVDICDTHGPSPAMIGAGVGVAVAGLGMIAGGVVLLLTSQTSYKVVDHPDLVLEARGRGLTLQF